MGDFVGELIQAEGTVLGDAWTEVLNGVTQIMSNSTAALGLTLPMVGLVVAIAKKLFRGRKG